MASTLYRKYRPKTFADVYGQDVAVQVLKHSLKQKSHSHAYLFAGARGTGKTSMARLLAKALNTPDFASRGDIDPNHENSLAIDAGNFLDLIEIDAASNRGIDEIRSLKDSVNFLPTQGEYKIYIIDEVHMLSHDAFNALLKTLEEPPAHAVFILATTEPHKVPVTVLSRVQRFDFRLAEFEEMQSKLKNIVEAEEVIVEEGVFDLVYKYSGGSFRDAESLLGKAIANLDPDNKKISLEVLRQILGIAPDEFIQSFTASLLNNDTTEALNFVKELKQQGHSIRQAVKQLIDNLRELTLTEAKQNQDYKNTLKLLRGLLSLQAELKFVDDASMLLEVFVLEYTSKQVDNKSDNNTGNSQQEQANQVPVKTINTKGNNKSSVNSSNTRQSQRQEQETASEKRKAAVTKASSLKQKLNSKKKQETTKSSENSGSTDKDEGNWENVLQLVKQEDMKLWAILRACFIDEKGKQLIIFPKYQNAVSNLNEHLETVRNFVVKVYGDNIELQVKEDKVIPESVKNEEEQSNGNESLVEEIFN